jgi:hypothetical protein
MGVTPMTLYYQAEPSFKAGGCQDVRGTTAIWASGAKAEVSSLSLCKNVGWSQRYLFTRPDTAGREIDMNYALQLERNGIMQQQLRQQQQNNAAIQNHLNSPKQTNCTTVYSGVVANTTCR